MDDKSPKKIDNALSKQDAPRTGKKIEAGHNVHAEISKLKHLLRVGSLITNAYRSNQKLNFKDVIEKDGTKSHLGYNLEGTRICRDITAKECTSYENYNPKTGLRIYCGIVTAKDKDGYLVRTNLDALGNIIFGVRSKIHSNGSVEHQIFSQGKWDKLAT